MPARWTEADLKRLTGAQVGEKVKLPRQKPVLHEEIMCIEFCNFVEKLPAPLRDFFFTHIPNGGLRHKVTAVRLKKMRARKGVWDYLFRKPYLPPLWLEFKFGKNTLTPEQVAFGEFVRGCGDHTAVAYTVDEALQHLVKHGYLPASVLG